MPPIETLIIGIDCAVDPKKVGVATGVSGPQGLQLKSAEICSSKQPPAQVVLSRIPLKGPIVLALDAPLGWPATLGQKLPVHQAGKPISVSAHKLFRRATDDFVKDKTGQRSLDVGADRIARTAVAALRLLETLRVNLKLPIPLAWGPDTKQRFTAIEVYPAATLKGRGIPNRGYKDSTASHRNRRKEMIESLDSQMDIGAHSSAMLEKADVLDAAICVLAADDFIRGLCWEPPAPELAKQEGWIWVRR